MMFDFVEAEEKHSPLLQKFYQEQTVVGHVNYAVQRTHSFFSITTDCFPMIFPPSCF